jgi:hypothetical protein
MCSVRLWCSHLSNKKVHPAATKPKGKRLLGGPIHKREDNIETDLEDKGNEDMD